jgi:hypothetical protein
MHPVVAVLQLRGRQHARGRVRAVVELDRERARRSRQGLAGPDRSQPATRKQPVNRAISARGTARAARCCMVLGRWMDASHALGNHLGAAGSSQLEDTAAVSSVVGLTLMILAAIRT